MGKKQKKVSCCGENIAKGSACKIESLVSVDERGQMILPKSLREKANIKAGDKLAIVGWEKDGKVSCISLIKVDDFVDMVKDSLGPIMEEIFKK